MMIQSSDNRFFASFLGFDSWDAEYECEDEQNKPVYLFIISFLWKQKYDLAKQKSQMSLQKLQGIEASFFMTREKKLPLPEENIQENPKVRSVKFIQSNVPTKASSLILFPLAPCLLHEKRLYRISCNCATFIIKSWASALYTGDVLMELFFFQTTWVYYFIF